ncbi:MAG: TetR/AcrR family transcriptional regulator, partial [Novosphingobium sp.]
RNRRVAAWNETVQTREQQFNLKRIAVLREATRAFNLQGYHGTSLDDVAKTLGVTKPALYYYFKNKQEILLEAHNLTLDLGDSAFEYAYENGKTGREILLAWSTKFIELFNSEVGDCAVLVEFQALDPANREIVAARRDKAQHQMEEIVERGIADGSIRQVDPKLTVLFFMGALNWMTRWYRQGGPRTSADIAAVFTDLLDHAVAP